MEQATIRSADPTKTVRRSWPPGPRGPGIVQGLRYARHPHGFLDTLRRRYGDVFTISFPLVGRIVYVAEPGLVKELFTGKPEQLHAGEANATVLEPAVGPNSVLTLDEGAHMRQRKLLLPPFHGDRIRRYGDLIREITEREMESWPVGEPFPLRPHTQRITLAVILRAVFGLEERGRFERAERLIDDFMGRIDLVTHLPFLQRDLGGWSPWGRFLRARAALRSFIYEEIERRRAELGRDGGEADDVLSLLLGARDEEGEPMSDDEVRDELVTVLVAGHETTATALAWAVERLLRNPGPLARLRASLEGGDEDYLEATVRETLRVRPVIVDVARRLTRPLAIGGYELPAGTFLFAALAALHYNEDLFPEPDRFRPERFLEGKPDNYAWIPFGGGVRRCIGASFAEYEMKVVLRAFLERAELSAPDEEPERAKIRNITVVPARGALVRLDRPLR